jgi:hypothetical protein
MVIFFDRVYYLHLCWTAVPPELAAIATGRGRKIFIEVL